MGKTSCQNADRETSTHEQAQGVHHLDDEKPSSQLAVPKPSVSAK